MKEEIESALLEALSVTRWNKEKTALTAVLTVEESQKICKGIESELSKAGYSIVKS